MKRTESTSSSQAFEKAQPEDFDLVILGGGTGSTVAAWTFASEGRHVAVVDRKYIGGSCPNIACLPSKNIIHSAKVATYFRRSKEFGITHSGFAIDMAAVRERKRKMVRGLNDMYMESYRNTGAEFILGSGRFLAPRTVEVTLADGTMRQLRGANVIVSTGTRAALEPIPGLAEAQPLTHIEALELDEIPEHLLVVGAGYVGVEMSQAMRRFGSKVTMIDRGGRLMAREDPDVCEALSSLLADEGIDVLLNARVRQVSGKCGDSVSVVVEQTGIEKVLKGSHILVATGRKPNTEGLGLELTAVSARARRALSRRHEGSLGQRRRERSVRMAAPCAIAHRHLTPDALTHIGLDEAQNSVRHVSPANDPDVTGGASGIRSQHRAGEGMKHRDRRRMLDFGLELVQQVTGPLCADRIKSNLLRFCNM